MYKMPLNYNPVITKSTKMTKENDTIGSAGNTNGIENSRGTEKSKSSWNQLFAVKPRNIVNSNENMNSNNAMNSKPSVSPKGPTNSRDNVYSNEFFDTNSGINYKNQSEKTSSLDFTDLSPKKLQEAIIWSEVLGKPVSKREKRR